MKKIKKIKILKKRQMSVSYVKAKPAENMYRLWLITVCSFT